MSVTALSQPEDAGGLLLGAYKAHVKNVEKTWRNPVGSLTPQDLASYAVVFGGAALAGYVAGRVLAVAFIR